MIHFITVFYSFLKSLFFDNDDEANFKSKNFKPRRWYSFFMAIAITLLGTKTLIKSYSVIYKITMYETILQERNKRILDLERRIEAVTLNNC